MARFGALALAVLALALPACGGDDNGDSEAGDGTQPGVADQAQTLAEDSGTTTSESDVEDDAPDRGEDEGDGGDGKGEREGGEQNPDPEPPSRAEYIRAADRICRTAQTAIARRSAEYREVYKALAQRKIKRQEYLRRGGELNERSGAIAQRAVDDLKRLPRPTSRREAIEAYLRGAAEQAVLLAQQGRALREGRIREVARLNRRVGQANRRTRSAARRVGFRTCGGGS